jgi:hypothetical protein
MNGNTSFNLIIVWSCIIINSNNKTLVLCDFHTTFCPNNLNQLFISEISDIWKQRNEKGYKLKETIQLIYIQCEKGHIIRQEKVSENQPNSYLRSVEKNIQVKSRNIMSNKNIAIHLV